MRLGGIWIYSRTLWSIWQPSLAALAPIASGLTLSPFFGQFKGFLKVDRKPASRDHFIHFEG